jgi:MFS family permease
MLESTFALVAEHVWSMSAQTVGGLFGTIGVIGIVVQGGLIGRLVRRFGEARLLLAGYACLVTGMALLASTGPGRLWLGEGWVGIVGGCAIVAVGHSLANPSLMSLVSRGTSADEQGSVLGVSQSLSALARALAPLVGGLLYSGWFPGGAFAGAALMMLGSLVIAVPAVRRAVAHPAG